MLVYPQKVAAGSDPTPAFVTELTVKGDVVSRVSESRSYDASTGITTITTTFTYDGMYYTLEVYVDGVQTGSAAKAIKSAWGLDMNVGADGSLTMK